jgi:hypothetical protein
MGSLRDDLDLAAGWAATTLAADGYVTDRSWASLREIDRFLERSTKRGHIRRRSLLAEHSPTLLFGVVAYVGTVLGQQLGGDWLVDDGDPEAELMMAVVLPSGTQVRPAVWVLDRIRRGDDASIAPQAESLREHEPVSAA